MSLRRLLGEDAVRRFLDDALFKQPFAEAGGAAHLRDLGTEATLRGIIDGNCPSSDESASTAGVDWLLARDGTLWDGESIQGFDDVRRLHEEGYTLVIRHTERHDAALAELAAGFAADFRAPVNIHVYWTPAARHGFSWHYDAEDVFIVQTTGVKEYSLRKNTVNPWPLIETMPRDMRFDREIMPVMQFALAAGDWLYIPSGYWHMGRGCESAISLAIGVMSTTALDVFDALRPRLLDSLRWRQRMPIPAATDAAHLREQYRQLLTELADDLQRALGEPTFVDELLSMRQ